MRNSIFSIEVYKHQGLWVFDDDRVGLVKEPFVAGADTLIDSLSKGNDRIVLVFSESPFPSQKLVIEQDTILSASGTNYVCKELNHKLWLCPALNLYYPISPLKIYIDFILPI